MRIPRKTELTKTRRSREKAVLLFGYDNKVKWLWEGDRKRETGMDADNLFVHTSVIIHEHLHPL